MLTRNYIVCLCHKTFYLSLMLKKNKLGCLSIDKSNVGMQLNSASLSQTFYASLK
jgi:hypothetical protein